MTQERTVLVIGATGGIGGEVARNLAARGWRVRALHRDPEAAARRAGLPSVEWVKGDAMDAGSVIAAAAGADLVLPLSRAAAVARVPVYFFGTSESVLKAAIARMKEMIPDLVVAGFEAPPMGFDPRGEAAREAARRIAASGAGICFVALGAPKQELFADTAVEAADGVIHLGIGAALDFIAGHHTRAPRFMQVSGLEWLWRAAQEPRRLIPRYFENAVWLARYVLRLAVEGSPSSSDAGKR